MLHFDSTCSFVNCSEKRDIFQKSLQITLYKCQVPLIMTPSRRKSSSWSADWIFLRDLAATTRGAWCRVNYSFVETIARPTFEFFFRWKSSRVEIWNFNEIIILLVRGKYRLSKSFLSGYFQLILNWQNQNLIRIFNRYYTKSH